MNHKFVFAGSSVIMPAVVVGCSMQEKLDKRIDGQTDADVMRLLSAIPTCSGKHIVITGATDGIGLAMSRILASKGANLIICARSLAKAKGLIEELALAYPQGDHKYVPLDLASFQSLERAVGLILAMGVDIDIIFANAGVVGDSEDTTACGLNRTFFVNHTAHFALITGILSCVKQDSASRVIMQSSVAHFTASSPSRYGAYFHAQSQSGPSVYSDSKLANILFAKGLQRYIDKNKPGILVRAVHPGYLVTNINRRMVDITFIQSILGLLAGNYKPLLLMLGRNLGFVQSSAQGASLPSLHAAFSPKPYLYTGPGGALGMSGYPAASRMSRFARCSKARDHLWQQSLQYCQSAASNKTLWDLKQ